MSSEMVIDNPAEQTTTLEQLLKEVNEMKDPSQFAQGANANPALMLDLIQRLSEHHTNYLHQKNQLNQANLRIQELERQNSEKSKKKLPRDNDALSKLVDLLGSKNNETRASEILDSDPFSGNKKDFNTWKESVMLKLNVNANCYPSEQAKMAYVYSQLGSSSKTHLQPWLTDRVLTFKSLSHVWAQLSVIFSNPNAKHDAANRLHANFQLNRPFSSWIAEIRRDATIAGYDTDSLQLRDLVFFNISIDLKKALVHERDIDNLDFDEAISRLQDIENRQRIVSTFLSRNGVKHMPNYPLPSPIPNQLHPTSSSHDTGDPMDLSASGLRSNGPLSQKERDRRRKFGLCYYCGEAGHKSVKCFKKQSRQPFMARSAGLLEEESIPESGKE